MDSGCGLSSNSISQSISDNRQDLSALFVLHPQPQCRTELFASALLESSVLNDFLDPPNCYPLRFIVNSQELRDHVHDNEKWLNVSDRVNQTDLTRYGRLFYVRCANKLRISDKGRKQQQQQQPLPSPSPPLRQPTTTPNDAEKFGPKSENANKGRRVVVVNRALLVYHPYRRCFTEYIFDKTWPDVAYFTNYRSINECLLREEPGDGGVGGGSSNEIYREMGSIFEQPYAVDLATKSCSMDAARPRRYIIGSWRVSMHEELEKLIKKIDHVAGLSPLLFGPSLSATTSRMELMQSRNLRRKRNNNNNNNAAARRHLMILSPPEPQTCVELDWTYRYSIDLTELKLWLIELDHRNATILLDPIDDLDSVIRTLRHEFHAVGDRRLPQITLLFLNIPQELLRDANTKCADLYGHPGAVAPLVVSTERTAERKAEFNRLTHHRLAEYSFLYQRQTDVDLEALYQSLFDSNAEMMAVVKRQVSAPDRESHCLMLGQDAEKLRPYLKSVFAPCHERGEFLHRLLVSPSPTLPSRTMTSTMIMSDDEDGDNMDSNYDDDEISAPPIKRSRPTSSAPSSGHSTNTATWKRSQHFQLAKDNEESQEEEEIDYRKPPPVLKPRLKLVPLRFSSPTPCLDRVSEYSKTLRRNEEQQSTSAKKMNVVPPVSTVRRIAPPCPPSPAPRPIAVDSSGEEEEEDDDDDEDDEEDSPIDNTQPTVEYFNEDESTNNEDENDVGDATDGESTESGYDDLDSSVPITNTTSSSRAEAAAAPPPPPLPQSRSGSRYGLALDILKSFGVGQKRIEDAEPIVSQFQLAEAHAANLKNKIRYFLDCYRGSCKSRKRIYEKAENDDQRKAMINPGWLVDPGEIAEYVNKHLCHTGGQYANGDGAVTRHTANGQDVSPIPDLEEAKNYLCTVSDSVAARSAYSFAALLAYIRSPPGADYIRILVGRNREKILEILGRETTEADDMPPWSFVECLRILNYLHSVIGRTDSMGQQFMLWYLKLTPCRRQLGKLPDTAYDPYAVDVLEVSTMNTILNALCSAYSIFALAAPKSKVKFNMRQEYNNLGGLQKNTIKRHLIASAGGARRDGNPVCSDDLFLCAEKQTDQITNQYCLYCFLVVIYLATSGLRPNSLGASMRKGKMRSREQKQRREVVERKRLLALANADGYVEDSAPDDEDLENSEDHDEDLENSEEEQEQQELLQEDKENDRNDSASPPPIDSLPCDALDFGGLRLRHIKIYRCPRYATDPPEVPCRLCVVVALPKDKVTGFRGKKMPHIGHFWPLRSHGGHQDYGPNACIALCLQAILVDHLQPQDLWSTETEPQGGKRVLISGRKNYKPSRPFFCAPPVSGSRSTFIDKMNPLRHFEIVVTKAVEMLGLPLSTVTARSFRSGYAHHLVRNLMLLYDDEAPMTKEQIRSLVYSGKRWSSIQVDVYLRALFENLPRDGPSETTTTVSDFLMAYYRSTLTARLDSYDHRTRAQFQSQLRQNHGDIELTRSDMNQIFKCVNTAAYLETVIVEKTPKELREMYSAGNRRRLDLKKTVKDFCRVAMEPAFHDICGSLFLDGLPTGLRLYTCPLADCQERIRYAQDCNEHWRTEHSEHITSKSCGVTYICPVCCNGKNMRRVVLSLCEIIFFSYNTMMSHLRTKHGTYRRINHEKGFCFHYI